ncbi:MAG: GNAT family N-acetyltransferase, partial [Actinomycetota bacterium]
MSRTIGIDYDVHPYSDSDEPRVLHLLKTSLGEGPTGIRTDHFFRWKHVDNPFGRSFMLIAEHEGNLVGFRSFMRWRLQAAAGELHAVRAVDTATHPEYQGRGIFSRLTRDALDALTGDADLVFNTPNDKSGPGYLKMGWTRVAPVPVAVRVRRPLRFASNLSSLKSGAPNRARPQIDAEPVARVLAHETDLADLFACQRADGRLATPRSLEYLRWRYSGARGLDYHAVIIEGSAGLDGIAIFRVRARGALWETTIAEVIVRPGDERAAREVLRRATRAARVDHITTHSPDGSAAARACPRAGFVPSRRGLVLFVNPLRSDLQPAPTALSSWALSLGDVE